MLKKSSLFSYLRGADGKLLRTPTSRVYFPLFDAVKPRWQQF